ncbi:MAG: hypothetical protein EA417_15765 [Gammaproteobacteria bacterium]|nr:MAG: hypothetical protein EA417_15765 [Gammaproteobacteria bacterium]
MNSRIALILVPALMLGCAAEEVAPDVVSAQEAPQVVEDAGANAPQVSSLVFENEHVRAMLVALEPGDEVPEHSGRERAVYSLTDYRILFAEEGESHEREWRAGQAHWHEARDHAVRNIGDTEARFLVVSRTEAALAETAALHIDHDAATIEEGFAALIFENDHVRITQVTLPPGTAQAEHHGVHRLVYSLSDYAIRYTSDRVETVERAFAAGDAHWHEADIHAVENIGSTEARFVIFQFKS